MSSNHRVHALMVGLSENWYRSGIMPCIRSDIGRDQPVPYIIWCIETPDGPVVVDTGYHPDIVGAAWAQGKNFLEPPKLLQEIGVNVDDVHSVIVTHFHIDHFTGFDFFPNATFVIQRREYDFWTGSMMRYEFFDQQIKPGARQALERFAQHGRLQLVDGDVELQPGLGVMEVGGHTPGSQMVTVESAKGRAVLCGDLAYHYRNLRERQPVGWYYNLEQAVVALDRALDTASRPELAFPNHDPELLEGKRVVRVL